jgi:hypothetical protein
MQAADQPENYAGKKRSLGPQDSHSEDIFSETHQRTVYWRLTDWAVYSFQLVRQKQGNARIEIS